MRDVHPEGGVGEGAYRGDGLREIGREEVEQGEGHAPRQAGLESAAHEVQDGIARPRREEREWQEDERQEGELNPDEPRVTCGFGAADSQGRSEGEEEAIEDDGRRFLEDGHLAIHPEAIVAARPPEEQRRDGQQPEQPRPLGQHPARHRRQVPALVAPGPHPEADREDDEHPHEPQVAEPRAMQGFGQPMQAERQLRRGLEQGLHGVAALLDLRLGVRHAEQPGELSGLPHVFLGELGGRQATVVLGLQDLVGPGAPAREVEDDLRGFRLAKAGGRVERVFAMQACEHRFRGAAVVPLEQDAQGFGLAQRRGEVLRVAQFGVVRRHLLDFREVAAAHGVVEAIRQLRAVMATTGFLLQPEVRNPMRQREESDRRQGERDEEPTEAALHHARGAVAAQHHRREVTCDDEEEFHPPAMDEGPRGREERAFAAVLDDPIRPHVRHAGVQDDPKQHREAAEGVVIVPTFVGQAGRQRTHPHLFVGGLFQLRDEPFQGGLRGGIGDFRLGGLQGGDVFRSGELEQGLLGFEAEGFFGEHGAEAWAHGSIIADNRCLDQRGPSSEVQLRIDDASFKGVGHAWAGGLGERGDDVLVEGFVLREVGEDRHGFGSTDFRQRQGGFGTERRVLLGRERRHLWGGGGRFRFREGGEEEAGGFPVDLGQRGADLAGQRGCGFVHQALAEVIDGRPANFHDRVHQRGERGSLPLPEGFQGFGVLGVVKRRGFGGTEQGGEEEEGGEVAHGASG